METVLRAAAFAAEKHRNQRRKDEEASPYINHPIQLAFILVQADVEDPVVLAAALLHDTIEDTETTLEELQIVFGFEIANIVAECSDNKSLTKLERKQAQIDHAAHISKRAKLVKLADKIANVNDINDAPPAGWSIDRKREYFDWAKKVVDQMRGTHAALEARFDAEFSKRP
jgi:GTP diphosphokinase / guanosine-3',5'-bis(diphosphate) 3'-diphosphatase